MLITPQSVKLASATAMLSLVAVCGAFAQLPVSRTVNVLPLAVGGANSVTAIGIPYLQETVARVVVTGVSAQDISTSATSLGALANTHMALVVTGPSRGLGLPITANTATTVTVTGTVPVLVTDSDEIEIVPLATLNSVFGGVATGGPFDLIGSGTASSADRVIFNGLFYFYKTTGVNAPGWKRTDQANAVGDLGTTVIPNLAGVNIARPATASAGLIGVRGVTRVNRAGLPIPTGTSLLSWPYAGDVTLLQSGLQNTITGAGSAGAADKIVINGVQYFYKTSGVNAPGWKRTDQANAAAPGANNVVLNTGGKAFNIIRSGTPVTHFVSQP